MLMVDVGYFTDYDEVKASVTTTGSKAEETFGDTSGTRLYSRSTATGRGSIEEPGRLVRSWTCPIG